MGQLNIYVPDDVEENIRNQSKKKIKASQNLYLICFWIFSKVAETCGKKNFFLK